MEIKLDLLHEIRDHQGAIKEIGVHPCGNMFFARSDDMLVVYNTSNFSKVMGFYDSSGYDAAMFDPANGMLVYMSEERLHFLDPVMLQERMVLSGELLEFRDRDVCSSSGLIADGNNEGNIEIRRIGEDPSDPAEFILGGHKNYIEYVRFHPHGKILSSGSADMTLRFWDIENRNEISSFKVHDDFVTALAFKPDGKVMVSGDYSGVLKVWDFTITE